MTNKEYVTKVLEESVGSVVESYFKFDYDSVDTVYCLQLQGRCYGSMTSEEKYFILEEIAEEYAEDWLSQVDMGCHGDYEITEMDIDEAGIDVTDCEDYDDLTDMDEYYTDYTLEDKETYGEETYNKMVDSVTEWLEENLQYCDDEVEKMLEVVKNGIALFLSELNEDDNYDELKTQFEDNYQEW